VVRQGKAVSTGEFGGAGITTAESMAVINRGLENFLKAMGVFVGKEIFANSSTETPDDYGKIIEFRDPLSFSTALCDGIYENRVDLLEQVKVGDVVGLIHNFKSADNAVVEVLARRSGTVALVRGYSPVTTGDVVCKIGELYPNLESFEISTREKGTR
jgi:predicted deacylase